MTTFSIYAFSFGKLAFPEIFLTFPKIFHEDEVNTHKSSGNYFIKRNYFQCIFVVNFEGARHLACNGCLNNLQDFVIMMSSLFIMTSSVLSLTSPKQSEFSS